MKQVLLPCWVPAMGSTQKVYPPLQSLTDPIDKFLGPRSPKHTPEVLNDGISMGAKAKSMSNWHGRSALRVRCKPRLHVLPSAADYAGSNRRLRPCHSHGNTHCPPNAPKCGDHPESWNTRVQKRANVRVWCHDSIGFADLPETHFGLPHKEEDLQG
jgi:hypothetical protein